MTDMHVLRVIGDQIQAAERDARFATSRREIKAARKRLVSLRKHARTVARDVRRTWGR